MKKWMILNACLAMSLASNAQNSNANINAASNSLNKADSLRMDSIIHTLPDVMVKGLQRTTPTKPSNNCRVSMKRTMR